MRVLATWQSFDISMYVRNYDVAGKSGGGIYLCRSKNPFLIATFDIADRCTDRAVCATAGSVIRTISWRIWSCPIRIIRRAECWQAIATLAYCKWLEAWRRARAIIYLVASSSPVRHTYQTDLMLGFLRRLHHWYKANVGPLEHRMSQVHWYLNELVACDGLVMYIDRLEQWRI
jgi:hypothetical protein